MRAEMVVGDIFMVIIPTGRRTGEALRGFAPSALSPCGSRVPNINHSSLSYQYRTSAVLCRIFCDKSHNYYADFCENLNNLYKET